MKDKQKIRIINGIIYKVISPSGKIYIGQTSRSLAKRKKDHINKANNPDSKEYNNKFANAIRKYGDNLKWEILMKDILTYDELNNLEVRLIKEYDSMNNGYNSTEGGLNGPLAPNVIEKLSGKNNHNYGKHMSEETKLKLSKSKTNPSDETRQKISIAAKIRIQKLGHPMTGKTTPKETKLLISGGLKEYFKNNPEAALDISKKAKKRLVGREAREKLSISLGGKLFNVFMKDTGEYIGTWINQAECAKDLNIPRQSIGQCLLKKYKSSKKYMFKYV